jgi:hypothetical protein
VFLREPFLLRPRFEVRDRHRHELGEFRDFRLRVGGHGFRVGCRGEDGPPEMPVDTDGGNDRRAQSQASRLRFNGAPRVFVAIEPRWSTRRIHRSAGAVCVQVPAAANLEQLVELPPAGDDCAASVGLVAVDQCALDPEKQTHLDGDAVEYLVWRGPTCDHRRDPPQRRLPGREPFRFADLRCSVCRGRLAHPEVVRPETTFQEAERSANLYKVPRMRCIGLG